MHLAAEQLGHFRARFSPMSFMRVPPLPMTIAFWLSRSTNICWWIAIDPSCRSSHVSVSTASHRAIPVELVDDLFAGDLGGNHPVGGVGDLVFRVMPRPFRYSRRQLLLEVRDAVAVAARP